VAIGAWKVEKPVVAPFRKRVVRNRVDAQNRAVSISSLSPAGTNFEAQMRGVIIAGPAPSHLASFNK